MAPVDRVECKPLRNLDELFSWKPSDSDWSALAQNLSPRCDYCYAGKDLQCHKNVPKPVRLLSSSVPKTLVCHDMMGGYLDDRFVYGTEYSDQYLFYQWSAIDIFVYFSHHFVTIPPVMWINAAHTHGVQILGTLITEHTDGVDIWNRIFADERDQNRFVDQLVAVQKRYRFDGYLVNIENELTTDQLPKLENFLRNLKSQIENGVVIWYDAVSFVNGKLEWQDELNEHNKPAFDICDGVFLNYNWNASKLEKSLSNAGARLRDVYVGIDVFPRDRKNAGGFYTKDALSAVRSFGMSAAIFAFGWTYEVEAKVNAKNFFSVEKEFWSKLLPYLYIHCPSCVPFKTDFNIGVARTRHNDSLWYDLSLQSVHLSLPSCWNENAERSCFDLTTTDGFSEGGGCLLLNTIDNETEIHKLMLCHFSTSEKSPLTMTIAAKTSGEFRPFVILLCVENKNRRFTLILQFSDNEEYSFGKVEYSCCIALSEEINKAKTIRTSSNRWITNCFSLKFDGTITDIVARIETPTMIGSLSFE
ncbi:hypothetical protein V9T40_004307 [Parthenolecanium corni]|uniref:Cytosolic endo-beta-N-acetylglucosaminidase TIM barrel domain-containing protein n=1 Tax=Parthenolecanium corni TaxID=536013 RepID=A0AAN9U1T1_9HEMI